MKNLILIVLLLASHGFLLAQTFHAILVADTRDVSLGPSCEKDLEQMSVRLEDIATKLQLQYKPIVITNALFGKAKLMKAITALNCTPQDIVFFYYTGHGFNKKDRASAFPLLYLKDDDTTELEAIHELLKARNPRFCVTLGDCCNNMISSRSLTPIFPIFRGRGLGVTLDRSILYQLFLQSEGDVLITSAQREQKATAHPQDGSLYSFSWMETLAMAENSNMIVSWESLLKDAENRLQQVLSHFSESAKHHSYWQIHLKETPSATPLPMPLNRISFDKINEFLNTLADERLDFDERNRLRLQKQAEFFAPEATVAIYINSPERPVASESVESFLKRIVSTAELIQQFHFVEIMSEASLDGKYRRVTLQEVRK